MTLSGGPCNIEREKIDVTVTPIKLKNKTRVEYYFFYMLWVHKIAFM